MLSRNVKALSQNNIIRSYRALARCTGFHARIPTISYQRRSFFWQRKKDEESDAEDKNTTSMTGEIIDVTGETTDNGGNLPVTKEPSHLQIKNVLAIPTTRPLLPGAVEPFLLTDRSIRSYLMKAAKEKPDEDIYIGVFFTKSGETAEDEDDTMQVKIVNNKVRVSNVHRTGTLAQIAQINQMPGSRSEIQLLVRGIQRIEIEKSKSYNPFVVDIKHCTDHKSDKENVTAFYQQIQKAIEDLSKNPKPSEMFLKRLEYYRSFVKDTDNVLLMCDITAYSLTSVEKEKLQEIVRELDVEKRLALIFEEIEREKRVYEVMGKVQSDVEKKLHDHHREHILKEHLKKIKSELGMEKDDKTTLEQKFRERLKLKTVPKDVMDVIDEEINKLNSLESASSEFNVTRNYLDWLTVLPYGVRSNEIFNLRNAINALDEDHYGMKDVKDRILEFIAVGKLKGSTAQGKIICLVGPPGTGKTSIGKSIARSTGRTFYRFSVGGLGDVSEIKGHRRTYVGAMPGKFAQAFKRTEVENPLILIDEIDKLGVGHHRGDAQAALLEALDPNQNDSFMDHYLDVPMDLSKVLFLCTANDRSLIPGPLQDRMEFVELSGYILHEKMQIAKQYLVKKAQESTGLINGEVQLEDSAIEHLIRWYCREAGVRHLEKKIEQIHRKCARKVVEKQEELQEQIDFEETAKAEKAAEEAILEDICEGEILESKPEDILEDMCEDEILESKSSSENIEGEGNEIINEEEELGKGFIVDPSGNAESTEKNEQAEKEEIKKVPAIIIDPMIITAENLEEYVGKPVFTTDRLYEATPVGTTMGLAYTSMGGTTLYVECAVVNKDEGKGGSIKFTGRLGESMSESAQIAFSYARAFMTKNYPDNSFFLDNNIHLSVIEAATPKDGPSAGVTLVTSLLSLALDKPVLTDFALTGEVSLTGKVLKIGGVREKVIAAKRSGAKVLCFPLENKKDFDELADYIKEDLTVHFVDYYQEVFDVALAYGEN